MNRFNWQNMTWKETAELDRCTVIVLPVGATEQHGPHLPLGTDSLIVEHIAARAADAASVPVRILPTLSVGASSYWTCFPGTLSLKTATLIQVVEDVCRPLIDHGFENLVLLNGHGGNHDPLKLAARNLADQTGCLLPVVSYWFIAEDELEAGAIGSIPGHAAHFETALMKAFHPDLVREEAIIAHQPPPQDRWRSRVFPREGRVSLPQHALPVSDEGLLDDPSRATAGMGEQYAQVIVAALAAFLADVYNGWAR